MIGVLAQKATVSSLAKRVAVPSLRTTTLLTNNNDTYNRPCFLHHQIIFIRRMDSTTSHNDKNSNCQQLQLLEQTAAQLRAECVYMWEAMQAEGVNNWYGIELARTHIDDGKFKDAAECVLSIYGGMGSFTDMYLTNDPSHFSKSQEKAFVLARKILTLLVNENDSAKIDGSG